MAGEKRCKYCGRLFTPGVRRPDQTACTAPDCQKKRQLENMRQWRKKKAASPDSEPWKEACRRKSAEWRKKHQAYLKMYREEHKDERSQYMKEYMRQYRERKRAPGADEKNK